MEVYWFSGSPFCWQVLMALELKGLTYESKLLDTSKKEHKTEAFLQLNPRGTVPVLCHSEMVVRDSMPILQYLEKHKPTPALFGSSPVETARIWERIVDHDGMFHPATRRVIRPLFRGTVSDHRDDVAAAIPEVDAQLSHLDATLKSSKWLGVDRPSAADVVYYPTMKRLIRALGKPGAEALDAPFANLSGRYPRIASWVDRVDALPGIDRTQPPHWA